MTPAARQPKNATMDRVLAEKPKSRGHQCGPLGRIRPAQCDPPWRAAFRTSDLLPDGPAQSRKQNTVSSPWSLRARIQKVDEQSGDQTPKPVRPYGAELDRIVER